VKPKHLVALLTALLVNSSPASVLAEHGARAPLLEWLAPSKRYPARQLGAIFDQIPPHARGTTGASPAAK
jgi:hypothetical protein